MHHPSGEEARVNRLRESRSKASAASQKRLAKVTLVGNETVESLRETRVTASLTQLQGDFFRARQQLSAALRESEEFTGELQAIDTELAKSECQS